jgi:hypothetical protein
MKSKPLIIAALPIVVLFVAGFTMRAAPVQGWLYDSCLDSGWIQHGDSHSTQLNAPPGAVAPARAITYGAATLRVAGSVLT